ncbi:NAD(P)-dependent oxidoreductase [Nocardiopsis terrae]
MPKTKRKTVAFLGLGRMGVRMARRLVDAGHRVTVWNRTPDRAAPLLEAGAASARTPAEAVSGAEVVITMLSDREAVENVLFGPDGAASNLSPGTPLVEMSTIGPEGVRELRDRLPEGTRLLDGPVLGSLPQAEQGALRIFLGGSAEDVSGCEPVLEELGTVVHVGPLGSGAALKLSVNLTFVTATAAVGEALALSDRHGLDSGTVLDALSLTPLGALIDRLRDRVTSPQPPPTGFSLGLADKDLALAVAEGARDDGAVAGALTLLTSARKAGLGDQDLSTIVRHVRSGAQQ